MNRFTPPCNLCAIVLLALSCLLGFGSVWAQKLEAHPEFDVGDKWTFKFNNIGDRREPYTFTVQAVRSENGSGWWYNESTERDARRPKFVQRYDYKRARVVEGFEFDPAAPNMVGSRYFNSQPKEDFIRFPLDIGQKYNYKVDWDDGNGYNEYKGVVESFEKVTLEAGEFEAFRIKFSGWWNRTRDGSGSGRVELILWWAPATKSFVKRTFKNWNGNGSQFNNFETTLLKWEPKAPLPDFLVK